MMVVVSGLIGCVGNKINVLILKWKIYVDLNDNFVMSLFFCMILLQLKGGYLVDLFVNLLIIDIFVLLNYDNLCIL